MSRRLAILFGVALALEPIALCAAQAWRVIQKDRAFQFRELTIARGDSVQFVNADPFLHQIYVESPDPSFESDEQPPGQTIEVRFPRAGTFQVRCHIHPKMLLTVTVR